uniref:Uncharacterized protein n=1 Tax=Parascaris equorum TaxID=6256 RepID=A0A914RQT7_PAREQ
MAHENPRCFCSSHPDVDERYYADASAECPSKADLKYPVLVLNHRILDAFHRFGFALLDRHSAEEIPKDRNLSPQPDE